MNYVKNDFSNSELRDYLQDYQSVEKVYERNGKKVYIFKRRCVLGQNGLPIPLDEFMSMERSILVHEIKEARHPSTKENVKKAKSAYKMQMKDFFGNNWKQLSEKHRIYNVPTDEKIKLAIRKKLL